MMGAPPGGSSLTTLSKPNYVSYAPHSEIVTLGVRASTYKFSGDRNIQSIAPLKVKILSGYHPWFTWTKNKLFWGLEDQGCRADISGLKQHNLCDSDPPSSTRGWMTVERPGQLSFHVIKPRQKQIIAEWWATQICPWAQMANMGCRCCSARKWRLSSWTFPAKFNIWLYKIIAL